MQRIISWLLSGVSAALLIFESCISASAVTLPDGAVEGLPSALTVMDDSGSTVSEDGEYFFEVTNMQPYTDYTKDIQIINLRDDKTYHIYFYAEPVSHSGDIDLNSECKAVFTLNGQEVFSGDVNGNPDDGGEKLSDSPIDLGSYAPGESGKLTCTVTWQGEYADLVMNYGKKLVSKDGTVVLEEESGEHYIEGEVYFRWVFCAVVEDDANSSDSTGGLTPSSGGKTPNTGVFSILGTVFVVIAGVIMVISVTSKSSIFRRRKRKEQDA